MTTTATSVGEETAPDRTAGNDTAPVVGLVVLAVVAAVLALVVHHVMFGHYSGDNDEPVYRFQAQMLEHGRITLSLAQEQFFRPWLSGPSGGHLVLAFPPGWPAMLAGADLVTGSMLTALPVAAALLVVGAYLFALELLGSRSRAFVVAALVSLSPFVVILSGTYLNYIMTFALELLFGFLFLRALRLRSRRTFAVAGALWGVVFLTRNFDAVLILLPLVGFAVATNRDRLRELAAMLGSWLIGVVPFLAVGAFYNVVTGGSPTAFSTTVQSEGASRFGWGMRSVASDTKFLDFSVPKAFSSLFDNLWAVPVWLLGAYVAVALAVVGAVVLWRRDRDRFWLLLALTFVFPVAYLAWWASALTTGGAWDGIGPHYYLPMIFPLAVLAVEGGVVVWQQRRAVAIAGVVAGLALTGVFLPGKVTPKIDGEARERHTDQTVSRLVAQTNTSVVALPRDKSPYVMHPYPYFANQPDLGNRVQYAVYRGADLIDLAQQRPGRRVSRLVFAFPPFGKQSEPTLEPVAWKEGPRMTVRVHLTNTSGERFVVAYLRIGKRVVDRRLVDTASARDRTYDASWTIDGAGRVAYTGPSAVRLRGAEHRAPRHGTISVGIGSGPTRADADETRSERRYDYRLHRGTVQVMTASEAWVLFGKPHPGWLPVQLVDTVDASFG